MKRSDLPVTKTVSRLARACGSVVSLKALSLPHLQQLLTVRYFEFGRLG